MRNVIVVGSINVDIIARVDDLPSPGQTLLGTDAVIRPGGKGANQAVAAARLGVPTRMIATVGDDDFAGQMRASLARAGVDVAGVTSVADMTTGLALIVVAANGENTIVVAPGANAALGPASVSQLRLERDDVLVLQLEVPLDTCLAAASAARAAGARVQLNAAPLTKAGDPVLADLLDRTDVLVVNETEAAELAGVVAPSDVDGWRALADRLPARASVITLGAQGAIAFDGQQTWWQPAFAVPVIDTTGAGDAFCGTLAQSLVEGHDLRESVRRGCAAGAMATGRVGAQSALPSAAELDAFLATEGR